MRSAVQASLVAVDRISLVARPLLGDWAHFRGDHGRSISGRRRSRGSLVDPRRGAVLVGQGRPDRLGDVPGVPLCCYRCAGGRGASLDAVTGRPGLARRVWGPDRDS